MNRPDLLRIYDELNAKSGSRINRYGLQARLDAGTDRAEIMKLEIFLKQVLIVLYLSALSLFSGAVADELDPEFGLDYRGTDCIWIRTIRDYTALDDRNLLIWSSPKRPYFVRLSVPAWGLRSSYQIGTMSRDDRLCPYGGDALVFDSAGRETSRIASIRRITDEEAEWLLVRFGKKDPAEQRAPEPEAVEGAEVEELD
jgi:hypothetical protein